MAHQCRQFLRALLQPVEQCHRLFLGEMATQFLDRLVVVVADGTVLRMKGGELRAVVEQSLVRDQYPEGLPEEVRLQEHRLRVHAGLLVHGEEPEPFPVVKTHHHAVRLAAFFRVPPPLGACSPVLVLVHITMDLVVSRPKRSFRQPHRR